MRWCSILYPASTDSARFQRAEFHCAKSLVLYKNSFDGLSSLMILRHCQSRSFNDLSRTHLCQRRWAFASRKLLYIRFHRSWRRIKNSKRIREFFASVRSTCVKWDKEEHLLNLSARRHRWRKSLKLKNIHLNKKRKQYFKFADDFYAPFEPSISFTNAVGSYACSCFIV